MPETLGICVTTSDNIQHLLGLARAANKAKVETEISLTGDGVHLTQDESFPELLEHGRVGACAVSYIARGYRGKDVPGLADKNFVTQTRNVEMVEECDRYLVL